MPEGLARTAGARPLRTTSSDAQPDPRPRISGDLRAGRGVHPAVRARPCPAAAATATTTGSARCSSSPARKPSTSTCSSASTQRFADGFGTRVRGDRPARGDRRRGAAPRSARGRAGHPHIEWMTQSHYVDSVRDDGELDPLFKSLLKHHWMEEAQHAKLDTLMVEALAEGRDEAGDRSARSTNISRSAMFLDDGLKAQAELQPRRARARDRPQARRRRARRAARAAAPGAALDLSRLRHDPPEVRGDARRDLARRARPHRRSRAGLLLNHPTKGEMTHARHHHAAPPSTASISTRSTRSSRRSSQDPGRGIVGFRVTTDWNGQTRSEIHGRRLSRCGGERDRAQLHDRRRRAARAARHRHARPTRRSC